MVARGNPHPAPLSDNLALSTGPKGVLVRKS